MQPWYIATERFAPDEGSPWDTFIDWSGLTQLDEVVSLDPMLCPTLLPDLQPDYWPNIVNEDFMLQFFTNLEFLRAQLAAFDDFNLLCVFRNPATQPTQIEGFAWLGYDLVDVQGSASALTNCGGFPDVFDDGELSTSGLIASHARAVEIQASLRSQYPDEAHANCHVWAIFRAV